MWPRIVLLGVVLIIGLAAMPAQLYPSDPRANRMAAIRLLTTGHLDVPRELVTGRFGEFYYFNEAKGKFYCKYGIAVTLAYAIPIGLELLLAGEISTRWHVLFMNLFNLAIALLFAWYLLRLLAAYGARPLVQAAFLLGACYATYEWNYLRAQSSELLQLCFFTACCAHLVEFRQRAEAGEFSLRGMLLAQLFLGLLCLTKLVYVLLPPLVAALLPLAAWRRGGRACLRRHLRAYLVAVVAPGCVIAAAVAAVNTLQFGAPWNGGYGQFEKEFFVTPLWSGLRELLLDPQTSIFLYFPLLVPALFAYPRFARRHPWDAAFLLSAFAIYLCLHAKARVPHGHWAYGPRYLVFIAPALSLPAALLGERFRPWRPAHGAAALVLAAALGYSSYLQVCVNRLPFFVYYVVRDGALAAARDPELERYFAQRHYGLINADLLAYRDEGADLYILQRARRSLTFLQVERLNAFIDRQLDSNLWWLGPRTRYGFP